MSRTVYRVVPTSVEFETTIGTPRDKSIIDLAVSPIAGPMCGGPAGLCPGAYISRVTRPAPAGSRWRHGRSGESEACPHTTFALPNFDSLKLLFISFHARLKLTPREGE